MSCRFDCEKCGYGRAIQPFYAGKSVLCPQCGHASTVPSGSVPYEIPVIPVSISQRPAPAPSEMSFRSTVSARPRAVPLFEGDQIEPDPIAEQPRGAQMRAVTVRRAMDAYRLPGRASSEAWEAARQARQAAAKRSRSVDGYSDLWFLVFALACTWFADTMFFVGGGHGGIGIGAVFCVAFVFVCVGTAVYRVAAVRDRAWVPVVAACIAAFSLGVYSLERVDPVRAEVMSAPSTGFGGMPSALMELRAEAHTHTPPVFEPGGMGWGASPPRFARLDDSSPDTATLRRIARMVEQVSPKVIERGVERFVLPEDHSEFVARLMPAEHREIQSIAGVTFRYARHKRGFNIMAYDRFDPSGAWRMVLAARPSSRGGFSYLAFAAE